MKAVQITMDESLLRRLDADPEVKRIGRSAVIRRAADAYLSRASALRIRAAYERAYGGAHASEIEEDLQDWSEEGAWPEK
jgi:metal-responsive CopG/Arc/MetJ family transcriptional regulator